MHIVVKIIIGVSIAIVIIAVVAIPARITRLNQLSGNGTAYRLARGSNSSGQSLYGVHRNVHPTSLGDRWSLCYSRTYATTMTQSSLIATLSSCHKANLLLGCRAVGTTTLLAAAMGDRNDVLFNCGSTSTCEKVSNGVSWYYSNAYSWGFARGIDTVNRNPCDLSNINPTERLCWLTNNGGGYRCGSLTGLTSSIAYEKVIYHSA